MSKKNSKQKSGKDRNISKSNRSKSSYKNVTSINLVVYLLPGALRQVPNSKENRIHEDIKQSLNIWGLPIKVAKIIETSSDFGLARGKLQCSSAFVNSSVFRSMEKRRVADGFPPEWITIWYVPNFRFSDNSTIACAYANRPVEKNLYQHIIMSDRTAAPENRSTLAHELGHIFFATTPGENNSDPTARNNPHSPISSNFMSTPAASKTEIDIRQLQKACRSWLVPECNQTLFRKFNRW